MSMFSQLQAELRRLSSALSTSNSGQRVMLRSQIKRLKSVAKGTPEYNALLKECRKKAAELNAPLIAQNSYYRYQVRPNISTGKCNVDASSFSDPISGDN